MKSLGQVEIFYRKKNCSISVESFAGASPYILYKKMYAKFPEFEKISAGKMDYNLKFDKWADWIRWCTKEIMSGYK